MRTLFTKLYLFAGMVLTIGLAVLVWNVTAGHLVHEVMVQRQTAAVAEAAAGARARQVPVSFKEMILDEDRKVRHYLGYRVLEQMHIEGHFHHIDMEIKPDHQSYCIGCHGDLPHDRIKAIRAFGNMHAAFLSCQTCHVRLEDEDKTGVYKWFDRKSGQIVESPVHQGAPARSYDAKIIPFVQSDGGPVRIDSPDKIDFAREYQRTEATLSDVQKAKAKKIIHGIVSKQPHGCQDCHREDDPVLPFASLGYPPRRAAAIVSTEVVGMIKNYTQFYMPRILNPGGASHPYGDT